MKNNEKVVLELINLAKEVVHSVRDIVLACIDSRSDDEE